MSIIISDLSYHYSYHPPLFEHLNLSVSSGRKVSITGRNGAGKSTLLKLLTGELHPSGGSIICSSSPYYIPQQIGIKGKSIGDALGVSGKIEALRAICSGSTNTDHYDTLADDWEIESRCRSALEYWGLGHLPIHASIDSLSGGEKTGLFLAGLIIHKPDIILLDEPTNHLDASRRQKLYDYIRTCHATFIIVSHDMTLLNQLQVTCELSSGQIKCYGGNYDFYREQKELEENALSQQIHAAEIQLRLARKKAQEVKEQQEKRAAQGERNRGQLPRILRKEFKDRGEATGSKLKEKHTGIICKSAQKLNSLREQQGIHCELKIDMESTRLHSGKRLVTGRKINFAYTGKPSLWSFPIDVEIRSGERTLLSGDNGSGKTTLVKLLAGTIQPTAGEIKRVGFSFVCLDQEYSIADTPLNVLALAGQYNLQSLPEHEIKTRLNRALFPKETWTESCRNLSGGERMRLCLCCLAISNQMPDLLILDEPTNNLDPASLTILINTLKNYRGTLLIISHDRYFIREIGITKVISVSRSGISRTAPADFDGAAGD